MNRKKFLTIIIVITMSTVLVLYNYFLHRELSIKGKDLKGVKQRTQLWQYKNKVNIKENKEQNKNKYSHVLKEIHSLKLLEINEMSLEEVNGSKCAKLQLCYTKTLEEFADDINIKKFFLKNKNFKIKSVIFKENKVIINMECIVL